MSGGTPVAPCWFIRLRQVRRVLSLIPALLMASGVGAAAQQPGAAEPEEEYGEFLRLRVVSWR